MSSVRSAIIFSSFSQYFLRALGFVSIVVFARLLSPNELGVFAIASSIAMLASEFRLLGAGNYLVRETELTKQKISSAIGLTILISWSLGLLIMASSGIVSRFYEQPDLQLILTILSLSFFFAPFISIISSILSRSLKYKKLLVIRVISQLTGFTTSITLVLLDYSFYSLAWGVFAGVFAEFLISVYLAPKNMYWWPSFSGLSKIAKFGIYSSLTGLFTRFSTTAPDLIIGKMGTPYEVAMFSRGVGFVDFLSNILIMGIKPVSLPYLSQVKRDGGCLADAYCRATSMIAVFCWPALAVAGVASYPVILFIFGDQWMEAVSIVPILALWASLRSIHTLATNLLVSVESDRLMLFKEFIIFCTIATGIILAQPHGFDAMAWALVITGLMEFLINSWAVNRAISLSLLKFVISQASNLGITCVCFLVAYSLEQWVNFESIDPLYSILLLSVVMPPIWLLCLVVFKHPLSNEIRRFIKQRGKV